MSVETRVEEFILAPSDPAWGDERNRDEYYRSMAVTSFWTTVAALVTSLIAAAEGARTASLAAVFLAGIAQWSGYRYCVRHDVPVSAINKAFMSARRRLMGLAIILPWASLWLALNLDGDASSVAGAIVGGISGALGVLALSTFLTRRERKREARAAAEDDVFE